MPEIHVLNVGSGDCTIFKSNSGHVTMFDVCGGNISPEDIRQNRLKILEESSVSGNFQMCKQPTNPLIFLKEKMKVNTIFRFVLSHPDMDHMDGFNNLMDNFSVYNFWDSGVRKEKPDFSQGQYKEEDWDRYELVRDGKAKGVTVISPLDGAQSKYFNMNEDGTEGGDYISIYAPSKELVEEANGSDESDAGNDASYVIVYRSAGGRILLPGDAHDKTWEYVLNNYGLLLTDCEFMLAPHHGRDSDRSWDFLDQIKPKFSVLGCAASKHLAYDAWNNRDLEKITQNQAGNIAIYPHAKGLDIYVQNQKFAEKYGGNVAALDKYDNFYLTSVNNS
jgi:competence protein ComEC